MGDRVGAGGLVVGDDARLDRCEEGAKREEGEGDNPAALEVSVHCSKSLNLRDLFLSPVLESLYSLAIVNW